METYSSSRTLVPMDGMMPSPFITKTYEMVDDPNTNHIVSWNRGGISFVVWDLHSFSTLILPLYFKHNNFSSFVRQLNTYFWRTFMISSAYNHCNMGFRKIDSERWEFVSEGFLMGQRDLLKSIKRRTSSSSSSSSSSPWLHHSQLDGEDTSFELWQLLEERHVLMTEIWKLKQEEQRARCYIQAMEQRLDRAENKQRHMMSFLKRAVENPLLLEKLFEMRKEVVEEDVMVNQTSLRKTEAVEDVSELEALGYGRQGINGLEMELDNGFWEELVVNNDNSEEEVNVRRVN